MKPKFSQRILSIFLCIALIMSCLPTLTFAAPEFPPVIVSDPGTADLWEEIMGTDRDGNRYAGRVWADKSVYKDGDTVTLNRKGDADSTFTVNVDEDNGEYFQVVFSALGSSMSTNTQTYSVRPLDVVLVLDTSTSMTYESSNDKTRFENMIVAANKLLEELLTLGDVRVAIVSFNHDSETIIGLNSYANGIELSVNSYTNINGGGVITAEDKNGNQLGKDSGFTRGTNLQDGIDKGMDILASATNTAGRAPVAIVLADGEANRAVSDDWYNPVPSNVGTNNNSGILLSTLLNAAYGRTRIEKNYGTDMSVYGIGIDLTTSNNAYPFLNPGAEDNSGFNESNTDFTAAWNAFNTWKGGTTATIGTWTFDHSWPTSDGVTTAEIAENINYVDNYQDVASADLEDAFDAIFNELSVGAFNPITDTKTGDLGVEETPLIYVDTIDQYMEVKEIQALQVFGQTFPITKNTNGTYSITAGNGVNPTTNENWNTASDIDIQLAHNPDGTQQLRIYIRQEILPILLDKISVTTDENGDTTRTLEEITYPPLRIYYTVGIDNSILLPDGRVNPSKISSEYIHKNTDGTADFYSNAFGSLKPEDTDEDGLVDKGDAHIGFVPSHSNRFYYYQAHQEVFKSAKNKDGTAIEWDPEMYGVLWDPDEYELEAMTYDDLSTLTDESEVYTYITFTRPVSGGTDNEAEEVTYLIALKWGDLKRSVTYYDKTKDQNLNDGEAIEVGEIETVVGEYLAANSDVTNTDLIAILGMKSQRVSRLYNMYKTKTDNATETAEISYAPEYNSSAHSDDDMHEHSEVIVWLGNNGKVTLPVASGIQISKNATAFANGDNANTTFEIHVEMNLEYTDSNIGLLSVRDSNGDALDSNKYSIYNSGGKILVTLHLTSGEKAIIAGAPDNTTFSVTEAENSKYHVSYYGAEQTVAGQIVEHTVTNSPVAPGNLYITKEVRHANGGEVFPTNYEFEFKVTFKDANDNPLANMTFDVENNHFPDMKTLSTDENGVMEGKLFHGETIYIKGIPDDTRIVVEEVNIPENYTVKYRSRDYSGGTIDNNGDVTIYENSNATVVVTNTYTPPPIAVNVNFAGTKVFDATEMLVDSTFNFKLQEYKNGSWTDVESKSVTVSNGTDEDTSFNFDSLNLKFTEPGIHSYQIVEDRSTNTNTDITYDRSEYTFSVNVSVGTDGNLKAEVIGHNVEEDFFEVTENEGTGEYLVDTTFTNYYHKTATSVLIKKQIEDEANSGKTPAGFTIESYEATVDENGNWRLGDFIRSTVTDAQGEALLVRNYDNTDFEGIAGDTATYHFIFKEKNDAKPGWIYDDTEYHATTVLTRAASGTITAEFEVYKVKDGKKFLVSDDGDTVVISFKNIYDPESAVINTSTDFSVTKFINGRALNDGEFQFAIFENGAARFDADHNLTNISDALSVGTNNADGTVSFDTSLLTFSEVGKYEFDIIEVKGTLPGVTYDTIIYDLVVEVADDNGKLVIKNHYFEDSVYNTVTFRNTYTVEPQEVIINGTKSLKVNSGIKSMRAGDYTFGLYNETNELIAQTTNLADGTFAFSAITYGTADIGSTYTYTVKEIAPDGTTDGSYTSGGVTWSGQTFTVSVAITDNGNGTITAAVDGNGSDIIHFVNEYTSNPAEVVLDGLKILQNRTLTAGEFTFTLYSTNRTFTDFTPITTDITHDKDGNFSVDLGSLGVGRHYFLLKENIPDVREKGIHYSKAEFYIAVVVTDHETGQMSYSTVVIDPSVPDVTNAAIEFTNVYIPEPTSLPLFGTKTYSGGKALEDDVFSVALYDSSEELLQTAPIKADGSFAFENLHFQASDVGNTYTYTIKEVIPAGATDNSDGTYTLDKNIYDGSVYTLTVSVTDNGGEVKASSVLTINGSSSDNISFTNTFVPDPITYSIEAKKIYQKGLKGDDFEFTLTSADSKTDINQTKKNDSVGDVKFDPITFTSDGVYKFTVKETNKTLGYIDYSDAEYEVSVTVANDNGVLSIADVSNVNIAGTSESNLEFVNVYSLDGEDEIILRGNKQLVGDRTQVESGEFDFGLYDNSGTLIDSAKNDSYGNFLFAPLVFDNTGVPIGGSKQEIYTIKEIKTSNSRYIYDETIYTVVVTVMDNNSGGVSTTYTVNGIQGNKAEIVFTNTYIDSSHYVTYTPTAKKNYNKELKGGDFKFKLEGEIDGALVSQEKTNSADGSITFNPLIFSRAGSYNFKVTEIDTALSFVQYSAEEYDLIVNIADTAGTLTVDSVTVNGEADKTIEFSNTYTLDGEDEITLSGIKNLIGDNAELKADEFCFGLYDDSDTLIESVKNDADGNFSFTPLVFDQTDVPIDGSKQVIYTVKEISGDNASYIYDDTVYTVVVTVKDNNEGGVVAEYTVNNDAKGLISFTNISTSNFKEIQLDFNVFKTVVNTGTEQIGPENFEFLLKAMTEGKSDLTAKTDESGNAKFSLTFNAYDIGKTYTYELTEINDGKQNVTYSTAKYTITVEISLDENNQLVANLTNNGVSATTINANFENIYSYTPSPSSPDEPQNPDSPQNPDTPQNSDTPQPRSNSQNPDDYQNTNNPQISDENQNTYNAQNSSNTQIYNNTTYNNNSSQYNNNYQYNNSSQNTNNPKTDDTTNAHLWFVLFLVSGSGVIVVTVYLIKKKLRKTK